MTAGNVIKICRWPGDVFGYLTGIIKEAGRNPRTRRVEKLAPGPIGFGARFGAEWIKGDPAIAGYVRSGRPVAWAAIARFRAWMRRAWGGSRRRNRAPGHGQNQTPAQGLLALLLPLMRRTVHEREDQNLERVKAILEGTR